MNFVYPLTKKTDVNKVTNFLKKHHPKIYSDFWVFALQTPLRISDLLKIQYDQLVIDKEGKKIRIKEIKTEKIEFIYLNKESEKIFNKRKKENPNDHFLFESNWRGYRKDNRHEPLNRKTIQDVLQDAGETLGLTLSPHVTRKTRAWFLYEKTNDLALVQHMLNHTHSSATLRYLGLTDQSKRATYRDLVL